MYIEDRLFSENNPEEVLFSVLMTEEEYSLYSEFQERIFGKIKQVSSAASEAFKGIGGQLSKGNKKYNKTHIKELLRKDAAADPYVSSKINGKYKELTKKPNVDLSKVDMENFAKVHGEIGRTARANGSNAKGRLDLPGVHDSMKNKKAGDLTWNKRSMKMWKWKK